MSRQTSISSSGFTLIEILVAVLVLAIGLLGMAALQGTGLRNNQTAYYRSQAAALAYEMSDRMRANKRAVDNNNYAAVVGTEAAPSYNCTTTFPGSATACLANEIALADISQWLTALRQTFPNGTGTITCTDNQDFGFTDADGNGINDADTDGDTCSSGGDPLFPVSSAHIITITWDHNRDGAVNSNPADTVPDDPTFRLRVTP